MEFIVKNAKETQKLAHKIIKKQIREKRNSALVFGLSGELGAGKTTFIQGLAEALKIKEKVLSPTFVIMKRFIISNLSFSNLYHIDCYRVEKFEEMMELGFGEILKNSKNIVVIEWAEKIKKILPEDAVWVNFEHLGENRRKIYLKM